MAGAGMKIVVGMAQRKLWTLPAARTRFLKRNLRIKPRIFGIDLRNYLITPRRHWMPARKK